MRMMGPNGKNQIGVPSVAGDYARAQRQGHDVARLMLQDALDEIAHSNLRHLGRVNGKIREVITLVPKDEYL